MILDEILANKWLEVASRRASRPESTLTPSASPPRGFLRSRRERREASNAPSHSGVSVIAEIKRRSPSGGQIRPDLTPSDVARLYASNGAAALSVLTDEKYFGGSDADLTEARTACDLPVLRKDFVVDAYQLHEARAIGADAVLLIVRALTDAELSALLALATELGLDALVEAHSEDEVKRSLDAGARIVGVNNRDLDTLVTDVTLAPRLRPMVPPECVFVAESGVSTPDHIAALAAARVDAVLIGEALLRAPDPGARVRQLVVAGRPAEVRA